MNYYFIIFVWCVWYITLHSTQSFEEIAMSIRTNDITTAKKYILAHPLSKKEYYNLIQIIAVSGDSKEYINLIKEIYKAAGRVTINELETTNTKKLVPYDEGEKIMAYYRNLDQNKSDVGYALIHDHSAVFSFLMQGDNKKFLQKRGCALAQSAVILGRVTILKMLLKHDIPLDCTIGIDENSIWHSAAITQHDNSVAIFELLKNYYENKTNKKLDISIENNNKETPLMATCGNICRYLRPEIVTYLLNKKSDPNQIDIYGSRPLHRASLWDCPAIIRILLAYGADPDTYDARNQTPLHIACDKLNIKSAFMLMKHNKTHINAKDSEENSPLHILLNKKNLDASERIKQKNLVLFLTESGAQWDILNKEGIAPLHYLEKTYDLYKETYLKKISDRDKKINWSVEQDDTGDTLLHLLVKKNVTHTTETQNITDAIQFLIEHKVSITHKNKKDETPLSICTKKLENKLPSKQAYNHYISINLIFSINQFLGTDSATLSKKTKNSLKKSLTKE